MTAYHPVTEPKATNCRWFIVVVATMMSIIMYLDRFCVGFAQSLIEEDLGLTGLEASWIYSAFFWAYALAQVPTGWLSDRWGGRLMLAIYIFSWSCFCFFIGWSMSLWFLITMQLGHGLAQAGAYPTSAGLLSRWMPLTSRGVASSIVAFGGRAGGVLAPILTAWLIVCFVPTDVPSQLTATQFRADQAAAMAMKLSDLSVNLESEAGAKESVPNVYQEFMSRLDSSTRVQFREMAKLQQQVDAQNSLILKDDPAARNLRPNVSASATQVQNFIASINENLSNPDWFSAEGLRQLNLAREAKTLLATREAKQRSLTKNESERFNRLVLEAAFPKTIGKIYVRGWRYVFAVYGGAGILIALLFWLIVRNSPEEHPWCNEAEVRLITAGMPSAKKAGDHSTPARPAMPWGQLLRSRGLWLSSFSQFGTNLGWLFVTTRLPEYLEKVHNVEMIQRGYLSSLPMAAGIVGMLLGGKLTDVLRIRMGLRWGRALPMGLTRFGAAAAFVGCIFVNDPIYATLFCAAGAFFTDLGVAATWAFVQDAGGRFVGVVLGFGNMWGNIGAAVAPQCYGLCLRLSHDDWNVAFAFCAISLTLSGIAALAIDATQPILTDTPAEMVEETK